MSKKVLVVFLWVIVMPTSFATEGTIHRSAYFRETVEQVVLPGDETMGMLGSSYLVETLPNLYAGGAAYGAVTGHRGGFFTVGGEVAWHKKIVSSWALESGLYVGGGGGGGATALVGGGLMLRPHVDVLWTAGDYRAGVTASVVSFPTGQISSNQWGVVFSADTQFRQRDPFFSSDEMESTQRGGVGFDRVHAVMGVYQGQVFAQQGVRSTIGLVGFRMEQMQTRNRYWGIEAAGAASGGAAGYAEFLATVGAEQTLAADLTLGVRAAAGMGGGGAVSVGGGQLYKLGAYASVHLNRSMQFEMEGGQAVAPDGLLNTRYAIANVILDLDHPFAETEVVNTDRYEWLGGTCRYLSTAHRDGVNSTMDVVSLKVNRYLDETLYLSGQAHSAYGGKEGGYSVGLFGVGLHTPTLWERLSLGGEMLLGAAGGGGVESSGGAIVAPNVFAEWQLNELFSMRLNTGRVKSLGGALNTQTVDLSINFSYATQSR